MESTTNNISVRNGDSLILDILYSEFGCQFVKQALEYKKHYDYFKIENLGLLTKTVDTLSYQWQMGNAKQYLESLSIDFQYYLICHLADGYIIDNVSRDNVSKDSEPVAV
jgi:hypothetical protein